MRINVSSLKTKFEEKNWSWNFNFEQISANIMIFAWFVRASVTMLIMSKPPRPPRRSRIWCSSCLIRFSCCTCRHNDCNTSMSCDTIMSLLSVVSSCRSWSITPKHVGFPYCLFLEQSWSPKWSLESKIKIFDTFFLLLLPYGDFMIWKMVSLFPWLEIWWVTNGLSASIACGYCIINYWWKLSYGHVLILTNLYAYIYKKSPTDLYLF